MLLDEAQSLPLGVGLLVGFLASLVVLVWIDNFSMSPVWRHLGVICLTAIGLIGAITGEISFLEAVVAVALGSAALTAATRVIEQFAQGESIEMESHWGGLGGALGGWRLSPVTGLLFVALVFAGGAFGLAVRGADESRDKKNGTIVAGTESKDAGKPNTPPAKLEKK